MKFNKFTNVLMGIQGMLLQVYIIFRKYMIDQLIYKMSLIFDIINYTLKFLKQTSIENIFLSDSLINSKFS